MSVEPPEKAVVQPGTQGLMYTGSEKAWPYAEQARPAPRGHKVPVPGDTGGAAMVVGATWRRFHDDGLGIRMGVSVGGVLDHMGAPSSPRRSTRPAGTSSGSW